MPPRSKNGWKISSLVSLNPREGGGKVDPARRQTNSQNRINTASTISGGTTRAAVSFAILMNFSARGVRFGVIVTTGAGAVASPAAAVSGSIAAIFIAGIFIAGCSLQMRLPRSDEGPPCERAAPIESDFNTLDGERLQV